MRERRSYRPQSAPPPEVRAATPDSPAVLTGYAALWNRYSQNLGGFVEVIEPLAFTDALNRSVSIAALVNHDSNWLLGTTGSDTLALEQDEIGLRYTITLDATDPDAVRAMAKVATGKMPGSSFSFAGAVDEWSTTDQGFPLRRLRSVPTLYDVGPVTHPAYLDTEQADAATALRSLADRLGCGLDHVVAAAAANELRSLLGSAPPPSETAQHATPLAVRRWAPRRTT